MPSVTQIDVKPYKPDHEVEQEQAQCLLRKVHVRGLPQNCDKATLQTLLTPFGPVSKTFIMYNHTDGSTRGFGFAEFQDPSSAEAAVKAGKVYLGSKELTICRAVPKDSPQPQPRPSKRDKRQCPRRRPKDISSSSEHNRVQLASAVGTSRQSTLPEYLFHSFLNSLPTISLSLENRWVDPLLLRFNRQPSKAI